MATTYYLTDTNSDLSGGADYNKYLDLSVGSSNSVVVSVANASTEVSYGFTQANDPSTSGVTGNYTIQINFSSVDSNIWLAIQLRRIDSGGTVQTSSGISAEQNLTTATNYQFSFTSLNLGTWSSGDRLRIDYRFRSAQAHGTDRSVTLSVGTTNTYVDTPWVLTHFLTSTNGISQANVTSVGTARRPLGSTGSSSSADVVSVGSSRFGLVSSGIGLIDGVVDGSRYIYLNTLLIN